MAEVQFIDLSGEIKADTRGMSFFPWQGRGSNLSRSQAPAPKRLSVGTVFPVKLQEAAVGSNRYDFSAWHSGSPGFFAYRR